MDSLSTKRTPKAVQTALQTLPTSLGDTYDQAMERIGATNEDDRRIAMNFLTWIAFATRPLTVAEVEHASSITVGAKELEKDNILEAGDLTSMCAGLVIVDANDIVRLVHFSAQTYFREHREKWFSNGHTLLAMSCLTYLSFKAFEAGACSGPGENEAFQSRTEQHPLTDYSASYWGFHAAKAQPLPELTGEIMSFLKSGPLLDSAVQAMWQSESLDLVSWDVKSGVHPLHLCSFFGLEQIVKTLLEAQNDVDCRDSLSTTPLMYAAAAGHATVIHTLLREGADANHACLRSSTALHRAVVYDHVDVVRHLLNVPDIDVNCIDSSNRDRTPLMLAVFSLESGILSMILQHPALDVDMHTGQYKSTALNLAASNGYAQAVRQIVSHPEIDVNKRDSVSPPLTKAAGAGFMSVVETLLDHGADPDLRDSPREGSGTPLNRAIDYGHISVVKILLQRGADPKILDTYRRTIIHSAAVNGQDEVLRVLLEKPRGVDINAQGTNGRTALHDAAYWNFCDTIRILFDHGARTDIHDAANRSPLGVAKDMNNLEALELLQKLRNQEKTRDALHEYGPLRHTQSSLDGTQMGLLTAVKLGMKDAVRSYIESSISDPNVDINLVDLDRHSSLQIAVLEDQIDILGMLIAAPNIRLDSLDRLRRSALHWCALHCNNEAAELLLDAGADFTIQDQFLETPLDIALHARYVDTAIALLERGAMPREQDMQHALRWAAEFGSVTLVERLVREGGADPERKDAAGMTLVKRAEESSNWKVVDAILRLCEEKERNRVPPVRVGMAEEKKEAVRVAIR